MSGGVRGSVEQYKRSTVEFEARLVALAPELAQRAGLRSGVRGTVAQWDALVAGVAALRCPVPSGLLDALRTAVRLRVATTEVFLVAANRSHSVETKRHQHFNTKLQEWLAALAPLSAPTHRAARASPAPPPPPPVLTAPLGGGAAAAAGGANAFAALGESEAADDDAGSDAGSGTAAAAADAAEARAQDAVTAYALGKSNVSPSDAGDEKVTVLSLLICDLEVIAHGVQVAWRRYARGSATLLGATLATNAMVKLATQLCAEAETALGLELTLPNIRRMLRPLVGSDDELDVMLSLPGVRGATACFPMLGSICGPATLGAPVFQGNSIFNVCMHAYEQTISSMRINTSKILLVPKEGHFGPHFSETPPGPLRAGSRRFASDTSGLADFLCGDILPLGPLYTAQNSQRPLMLSYDLPGDPAQTRRSGVLVPQSAARAQRSQEVRMSLDPLPVLVTEFFGPKRKLRLSTAFAVHMSARALLEVQGQGRVGALRASVQQGLLRLATQLEVALARRPQSALASGIYADSREGLELAAKSVRWDFDLQGLAQRTLDDAALRLGQPATRSAALAFQHPWAAGQQLLRVAYDVGVLLGVDTLAQAAVARPICHVYNAFLRTGLLPAIPILDELVAWLCDGLFVGGTVPTEKGSFAQSFLLAYGVSSAAFSAENQARRAAASARANGDAGAGAGGRKRNQRNQRTRGAAARAAAGEIGSALGRDIVPGEIIPSRPLEAFEPWIMCRSVGRLLSGEAFAEALGSGGLSGDRAVAQRAIDALVEQTCDEARKEEAGPLPRLGGSLVGLALALERLARDVIAAMADGPDEIGVVVPLHGAMNDLELKTTINFNLFRLLVGLDVQGAAGDDPEVIGNVRRLLVAMSPHHTALVDLQLEHPGFIESQARAVRRALDAFQRFFADPHKLAKEWSFFNDGTAERAAQAEYERAQGASGERDLGDDSDEEDGVGGDSDDEENSGSDDSGHEDMSGCSREYSDAMRDPLLPTIMKRAYREGRDPTKVYIETPPTVDGGEPGCYHVNPTLVLEYYTKRFGRGEMPGVRPPPKGAGPGLLYQID
jgi:hypothetical protein